MAIHGWSNDKSSPGWKGNRSKSNRQREKGTKRSMLTEGSGIPLSVAVDGANRHDKKLVKGTLDAIIIERPSSNNVYQNMCMDKGYDFPNIRELVEDCL